MKIPDTYHSAFAAEASNLGELDSFTSEKGHVFQHDINDGLVDIFHTADCVYTEPAWLRGYETFRARAGGAGHSFNAYLAAIRKMVEALNKPTFVLGGRHMLQRLEPHASERVRLNGFDALLMVWNAKLPGCKTKPQLVSALASEYRKVLDFCCGYGEHLTQFQSFIGCDINRKCVYYIAHNYMGYTP